MSDLDPRIRIGLRAAELRAMAGLSQEKFCYGIGMARSYYADIESGTRNVAIVNIARIAHGFGMTLREFFDSPIFDETPHPTPVLPARLDYHAMNLDHLDDETGENAEA